MRCLSETLRSFVRWQSNAEVLTLQTDFEWPQELHEIKNRFIGYTWGKPLNPNRLTLYGICPLSTRWPEDLAADEQAIYTPNRNEHLPPHTGEDLDHYLTIELLAPNTAIANLAMLVQQRDWYLLDSHVLTIK